MPQGGEQPEDRGPGRGLPIAYDEPFAWWGPVWQTPPRRNVLDLIRDGTLPVAWAAALWALLARRASIVVAAGPRGAGKTTVLTALLDFYPAGTRRIYLRGCYEPFRFLDDPGVERGRSLVLVNEISAHLPVYLWGPGVGRALATIGHGYALAATAHATDAAGFVGSLVGYPLRIAPSLVAGVDLLVLLGGAAGRARGSVESLWLVDRGTVVEAGGKGMSVERLGADPAAPLDISPVVEKWTRPRARAAGGGRGGGEEGLVSRSELDREVGARAAFLSRLLERVDPVAGSVVLAGAGGELAAEMASFSPGVEAEDGRPAGGRDG